MNQIENLQYQENNLEKNISGIANLYAKVFAFPPWNEAVKCDQDGQFKGLEIPVGSKCDCGGTFIEAYPPKETLEYIQKESQKPGFKIIQITDKDKLVGFAWSYLITPENLITSKWIDNQNQENIASIFRMNNLDPKKYIRYLSECGIDSNFRGLSLSNQLINLTMGSEPNVYRTNYQSPMMAVANKLGFTQIMGPEVIIDRQSKTIIETGQTINFLDLENSQRTLFIKK